MRHPRGNEVAAGKRMAIVESVPLPAIAAEAHPIDGSCPL
jgi:hypothetical protein